ncbi:hypothetical protein [Winogradskyella sp. R77965]|uniref:hypothetical protein n=1 Tax=Winogradskyella sp. R77965 TaxID=3093872 RepID=UPI0037DDCF93
MTNWLNIKDKLNDSIGFAKQLLLLLLGVYVFILAEDQRLLKVPLFFIGLLSWFLWRDRIKHPIIWIVFLVTLLLDLYHSYFWVANHHFMLLFMVLSIIFFYYHKSQNILLINIQIIVIIVVLTSALQKLLSSQFVSGDFYYYMMNRGKLFNFFINFFPEIHQVAESNEESLLALYATDPNLEQSIVLKDVVPNLRLISLIFSWVTVAVEFLVAVALIWKPRSMWTHLLFAGMILGILCVRFETGFMGLLAICGLFLCKNLKLRVLYTIIVMACISLIVTKIGFH